MITGVRLTQLANGEPLLSSPWHYNNLSGINAVQERLSDLFSIAQEIGFEFIIDTIKPTLMPNGELTLANNGAYGNLWSFTERINLYELLLIKYKLNILMEIEFPTIITDNNWQIYADYFISLVEKYPWIEYWQIMTLPETKDSNNNYKCSPMHYVRFLKYIYPIIKTRFSGIKIGGPGIFDALLDYINRSSNPTDWLSAAIGDTYAMHTPEYTDIGLNGFLPFIDFFSIQAKQNISSRLSYENFPQTIDKLISGLKLKMNQEFLIFSTYQGRAAYMNNSNTLNEQGYYDLREMLNCIKKGIIPFKAQLVDEYFNINTQIDNDKYHMGVIQYFMGNDAKKPSFFEYKFLLNNLRGFNKITNTNQVVDNYNNIDIITFINNNESKTATIIWPKTVDTTTVTLQPHYARQYITSNGEKNNIINPTQFLFNVESSDGIKFIIVFQTINKSIINVEELENSVNKKLNYTEETLKHFISLLPSTYNKEITDVNYYKILRAIALEMADAKIVVDRLSDNLYLDTVSDEAIYNNFGTLVNLSKKADWSNDKYRRLVKGVMKSLLDGPTHDSIVNAVKLFTNFNVNVYELYKNYIHIDTHILGNTSPQYAFVVEIEKPIDVPAELDVILEDANYVINIVKPAHTIQFVIVMLSGEENYKTYYQNKYGKEFTQDASQYDVDANLNNIEGIYGWKALNYDGQFKTTDTNNNDIFANNSLTNGALLLGPRYILYDECINLIEYNPSEKYAEIVDELIYSKQDFYNDFYDQVYEIPLSDFDMGFAEIKFGFNPASCMQLTSKTLNNFRLAPSSQLDATLLAQIEWFLQEKYSAKADILHHEFELFYKDHCNLTIIDKEEYDVDFNEAIKNFLESGQFINELPQFEEYNTNEIQEQNYDKDILIEENNHGTMLASLPDINLDIKLEQYRTWTLSDSWYHIHKKQNIMVSPMSVEDTFRFADGDLTEIESVEPESVTRVYVNGILQPSFNYTEMTTFIVPNRVLGIKFEPDILMTGDIVSILYLSVQQLTIADFPIVESCTVDIMFNNIEIFKNIKNNDILLEPRLDYTGDNLDESYINIIGRIKEVCLFTDNGHNFEEDKFSNVLDMPTFEGDPYYDIVDWNKSFINSPFTLNQSKLNLWLLGIRANYLTNPTFNSLYERNNLETTCVCETFNTPVEIYEMVES